MKKIKLRKKYIDIINSSKFYFEEVTEKNNCPRWVAIFLSVIDQYKRISFASDNKYVINDESDSFIIFITPFIKVACLEVTSKHSMFYKSLNEQCQLKLEIQLAKKLKRICSSTLTTSFEKNDMGYDLGAYINALYKKPLVFFKEYSVLAKLLSMHTDYWIQSTSKLIKRLQSDFDEFDTRFFNIYCDNPSDEEIVKMIVGLQLDLSDPHEKGQSVTIVEFNNGEKVVYKPKSVMAEQSFGRFVEWLNGCTELQLEYLPVIDKGSYGWVKYIEHKSCENNEEISRFYSRIGMSSALLYVLRGMDYHNENLIAHGEYPFFIDHEMLFYPIYVDAENKELIAKSESKTDVQSGYYESILNTRLYPIVEKRVNGTISDVSAVGHCSSDKINTHLPVNDCAIHDPGKYVSNIIDGFKTVYEIIRDNKDDLLSESGLISYFSQSSYRYNIRSTSSYLSINNLSIYSDAFKSGDNFCNRIHAARSKMQAIFSRVIPPDIMLEEMKILSRLDVPRFTIYSQDRHLLSPDHKCLTEIFKYSGVELVEQRIMDMSDADLYNQIKYIEDSING